MVLNSEDGYNEKSWITVLLEVGHNELGDADEPDYSLADDIVCLFEELGFPAPSPIPLMPLHHQIAQKLHGLSEDGSMRAHDLVDLQVIVKNETIDCSVVKETCQRLFAYRKLQTWPPTIMLHDRWVQLYDDARTDLDVVDNVEDAVTWANDLIRKIAAAG